MQDLAEKKDAAEDTRGALETANRAADGALLEKRAALLSAQLLSVPVAESATEKTIYFFFDTI